MPHFTLSYAGASHAWAAWIGDQLALQTHSCGKHRWDPRPGLPLADAYHELLTATSGPVVLLLDDRHLALAGRDPAEWARALNEAVRPHRDRVTVVDVATRELPPAVGELRPVGLLDLDESEARRRLFTALGMDTSAVETLTADGTPPMHRCPNTPPAVWQGPRRNGRFTGRESYLETVHDSFLNSSAGTARVGLIGVQGVGKTQIADEYIHRFGNEYDVVWYVNAESRPQARQQLGDLAGRLGWTAEGQRGEMIGLVHESLRRGDPYRRWLLVLDGAEDVEGLAELIPEGRGHVLLTTRNAEWSGQGVSLVEVEPFRRAESVDFARLRAGRLTTDEAGRLADVAEDFPLMLDQCAAWLERNPSMDLDEYLGLVRRGDIKAEPGAGYPQTFDKAWALTFNKLREDPPSYVLLSMLVFFAPGAVPVRLLRTARRADLPSPLGDLVADPGEWNTALRKLREAAAIRIEYENHQGGGDTLQVRNVRMHRVYQSLVRSNMGILEYREAAGSAARILAAADPRDPQDRANWNRYDELVPHLESSGVLTSDDAAVHDFVLNCIEYLRVRGEYTTGWSLSRALVEHLRPRLATTDRVLLVAEHQHANMLRRMGRYADAAEAGRRIVESLRAAGGRARPLDVLRAEDGLAGSLMGLGRYREAHDLFAHEVRAIARELGMDGDEPPTLITGGSRPLGGRYEAARNNLGIAQSLLGRYQDALASHREVLEEHRQSLGEQHPQTLQSTLRCAWNLRLLGRYAEAESVQSLNAHRCARVLDKHHEQTLHADLNLALCLDRTGHPERAEAILRGVRRRTRRKLGDRHPETLMADADYAMLLRRHGDADEARALAQDTAARYTRLFGPAHPYAIGTAGNCGLMDWGSSEAPRALAVAEEAWRNMREAVGDHHPWTLGCALNVVGARRLTGEDETATRLARQLREPAARVLGESHPLALGAGSALAQCLHESGDGQAADKERRRVLRLAADAYGEEHAVTRGIRLRVLPHWEFEPQPI